MTDKIDEIKNLLVNAFRAVKTKIRLCFDANGGHTLHFN